MAAKKATKKTARNAAKKPAAKAPKRPVGRPTIYSDELVTELLFRIAEGQSLRQVCAKKDMPDRRTIYRWLDEKQDFATKYAQAMELRGDAKADELDVMLLEEPERDDKGRIDPGWVQWMRAKIHAHQWFAEKLKARRYGRNLKLEHTVDDKLASKLLSARKRVLAGAKGGRKKAK